MACLTFLGLGGDTSSFRKFPVISEGARQEHGVGSVVLEKLFGLRIPAELSSLLDRDERELAERVRADCGLDVADRPVPRFDCVEEIAGRTLLI